MAKKDRIQLLWVVFFYVPVRGATPESIGV